MKARRQKPTFWGVLRSLARGVGSILAVLGMFALAIYSMFAVHVVARETTRGLFGEPLGLCGLEYFVGPGILILIFFGVLKLKEISSSKKQKVTVSEFCLRAATALADDPPDFKALGDLYGEGLVYREKWGADTRLNERIGILRYMVERESGNRFKKQFMNTPE